MTTPAHDRRIANRSDDSDELTFEEGLSELGKDVRRFGGRVNLREYFQLLEWAKLYACLPRDGAWTTGIGYEISGVRYALLFSTEAAAADAGAPDYFPRRVRVREMLERLPDGWGLIVDHGSDAELRLSPDELTEQNERIRIKPVRREATDAWLAETNDDLKRRGVPREQRAAEAKALWATINGFRVLPGSKRARRIEWYFDVVADATPNEARERCSALWRTAYDSDPYLQHLTDDDLRRRSLAIRTNLLFTDRKALPHEWDEREWRELLEHVRYEHGRRGLPFAESIDVAERLAAWPRFDAAANVCARYSGPTGDLYKFGDIKYLEPILRAGIIRVFPANRFADPSLLPAQQDDELTRTVLLDGAKLQLTHTDAAGVTHPLHAIGKVEMTARPRTNYYLWCTTSTLDPRLFDDFGANACLVIHNANMFIERLQSAMAAAGQGFVGASMLVHYYDPVRPGDTVLGPSDKDFRYAYQREYRFVWERAPRTAASGPFQPIDVCLGNLEDIANIILL